LPGSLPISPTRDKSRCYGLYANAHRLKVRKSEEAEHNFLIVEEEFPRIPRQGRAAETSADYFS